VAIVLALFSALAYGVADFLGGVASRRWDSRLITLGTQSVGLLTAAVAVAAYPGDGPARTALAWGAASGLCCAVGILSLYRGFARGSIGVVAPVCGVLTAVIPAAVGIALGDHLGRLELVGIILTIPAVGLVARETAVAGGSSGGFADGVLAGVGFGLLFVALSQAGSSHGAWPLLAEQVVAVAIIVPVAIRARNSDEAVGTRGRPPGQVILWTVIAGVLSGVANLLYLLATHHGELAIVGVISSLYPAATVLMARFWLRERWNRVQITGMALAAVAVVLVAV
jgi:drug/metabolite transporter (DMT)-like permease